MKKYRHAGSVVVKLCISSSYLPVTRAAGRAISSSSYRGVITA